MRPRIHFALAVLVCALLSACGTPGAPRPPSLDLPRPPGDLSAGRVGDRVTLTWTAPAETTDRQNVRHPGPVHICRGVNVTAMVSCAPVGELPPAPAISKQGKAETRQYTDVLPPDLQKQNPTGFAAYAVEALNLRGRSAGLSNQIQVPLAPTFPPPTEIRSDLRSDSVVIIASGVEPLPASLPQGLTVAFHLYRRQDNGPEADLGAALIAVGSGPGGYRREFVDRSFEWEKTYLYHVVELTTVAVEGKPPVQVTGEPSAEVKVFTKDIFPPAVPSGLQAVASGVGQPPFVDLTWAPNTESDLAGYNVYRHEEGQPAVKINNELVKTPAYRDRSVAPGHKYFYAVTAVDLHGNESAKSQEASETVP